MPKGTMNYSNGLIYTIKTGDSVYVGSTTNFTKRKCRHKSNLKNKQNIKLYQTINENGNKWEMKAYKLFPCNSKQELEIEEETIRRELNADLNMKKVCFLNKEEKIIEIKKTNNKCYENNKDKFLLKRKKWRENNRDIYLNSKKKYHENNRETILQKKIEKINCDCGSIICRSALARHKTSKKHQDFIMSSNIT
tara:strand:- start:195 stop:776 length:582 start_codon:yes stop_codon:yes gene_type:complete